MKCPKCGHELRESKKTPGYFLCDSCKKKFSQETLDRFQAARPVRKKKAAPKAAVKDTEESVPETMPVSEAPEQPKAEPARPEPEQLDEQPEKAAQPEENVPDAQNWTP